MTPVGHCLVGVTVGVVYCHARKLPVRSQLPVFAGLVLCANIPDLPLPNWGHDRYDISHSLFVGLALVFCATLLFRLLPQLRNKLGSWPFLLAGSATLFSHYLLDSFYNHGIGLPVGWPFSETRLALPVPWFSTMTLSPLFGWHNIKVWSIEFFSYGTLLAIAWSCLHTLQNKSVTPEAKNS